MRVSVQDWGEQMVNQTIFDSRRFATTKQTWAEAFSRLGRPKVEQEDVAGCSWPVNEGDRHTSLTKRVPGSKTKTSVGCVIGKSKSQNRAVEKDAEKRNERRDEEKKVRVRSLSTRCRLQQGSRLLLKSACPR